MAVSIVQWVVAENGSGSTSIGATFSSAPSSSNVVVAFIATRNNATITPVQGGSSSVGSFSVSSDLKVQAFFYTSPSGTTTYGHGLSTSSRATIHLVELSGASTSTPTNWVANGNATANSNVTANPTGDGVGDFFFGFGVHDNTTLTSGGSSVSDQPTGNVISSSGGGSAALKLKSIGQFIEETVAGSNYAVSIQPTAAQMHIAAAFAVSPAATATPKTGTDSGNLTATETSSLVVSTIISTGDSGNITGTDSVVTPHVITSTRTDTGNLTPLSEGMSDLSATSTRTDTGNITGTDASSTSVVLNRTDTGNLTSTEAGSVASAAQPIVAQDSGVFSADSETASVFSFQLFSSVSDTGLIVADDNAAGISSVSSRTDTGNLTSTESGTVFVPVPTRTDTGNLTVTEGRTITGQIDTSDSGNLTATESASIFVPISVNDDGDITGDDVALDISPNLFRTDTGNLTATESRTIAADSSRTDTGNLTSTETSTVFKSLPFSDTGTLSATESATIKIVSSASDSGTLSAVERRSKTKTAVYNVQRWNGTSFDTVPLRVWDGIAFVNPTAWRWNGTSFDAL